MLMKRTLLKELITWKEAPNRLPLVLRGIRQVGKTTRITLFGETYFENICTVNFEQKPELKTIFDSRSPEEIIFKLELTLNEKITPLKTLLFLDEIQESPNAILALRYFKEEIPTLHVIAAGSLLEFALNSEEFRMPVGRVQYMYLYPFSFKEFLLAINKENLANYLDTLSLKTQVEPVIHQQLLELLKRYFIIGGMPAVLQTYLDTKSYIAVQQMQANLIQSFEDDFPKYHAKIDYKILRALFNKIPRFIGQKIKFSRLIEGETIYKIKQHLDALRLAGLIIPIYKTKASGIPLGVDYKENQIKFLFADIGLTNKLCDLRGEIEQVSDVTLINQGAIAEQFVGQELLCSAPAYERQPLYFWEREKVGSMAEMDYVIQKGSKIIPIEVKAGKTGRLKSLQQFLTEKQAPFGLQISQKPLGINHHILSVPLYMMAQLPRLIEGLTL